MQISTLSTLALHKLHRQFAQTSLEKLPSLIIELAREVFIARADEKELREALVEMFAGWARELSSREEFNDLVKEGGECVVLFFTRLALCEC